MPQPTIEHARQDFDDVAWDKNDTDWASAQAALLKKSLCHALETFTSSKLGKPATWITPMILGGFNNLYCMRVEDFPSDVLVRRPSVSQAQFPAEKTRREAVTARYVGGVAGVLVPRVLWYSGESEVGPVLIIEHVENKSTLSHVLTVPGVDNSVTHALDPGISESVLREFYLKVARIVLELSQHRFPRIGSLLESDDGSFYVGGRPLTQNMSDMLQLANIPSAIFPPEFKTFESADEYYINLATGHIAQLIFQHNDLVKSADDCRNKYVARQLFLQLAKQGKLSTFGFAEDDWSAQSQSKSQSSELLPAPSNIDGFRLYGDDFRPGNILINDANEIVSVIDWEFTYAAPTQFILDPPWWLLLDTPEMWDAGIEDWVETYESRLETWLSATEEAETTCSDSKSKSEFNSKSKAESGGYPLSAYMRQSWETGRFWLSYAARKSWAFDTIFWNYLDERFFGPRGGEIEKDGFWMARMGLLGESAREAMEGFVEGKMEEMKVRELVEWDSDAARRRLAELVFD